MLRVTVRDDERGAAFKLEGKLAHEWVAEAEKAWTEFSSVPRRERVVVDLCGVSFVDDSGRELLGRIHASGAKLIGTGPMTSALIEEICGQSQRPDRRWTRGVFSLFFLLLVSGVPLKETVVDLVGSTFAWHLIYRIPGWIFSLQSYLGDSWKGLLR
jgi:anti-anti-sigma regulatory factor